MTDEFPPSAPFWVPNYPTFRYTRFYSDLDREFLFRLFSPGDTNETFGGFNIGEENESKRGLTKAIVNFVSENPPKRWIFTKRFEKLNQQIERVKSVVKKECFKNFQITSKVSKTETWLYRFERVRPCVARSCAKRYCKVFCAFH